MAREGLSGAEPCVETYGGETMGMAGSRKKREQVEGPAVRTLLVSWRHGEKPTELEQRGGGGRI